MVNDKIFDNNQKGILPSEKAKRLAADYSVEFLQSRMRISRDCLIKSNDLTITLNDYVNELKSNNDSKYKYHLDQVLVSDGEIEELSGLVRYSLIRYQLLNCDFNGSFIEYIKLALDNLVKYISQDNILVDHDKIKMFTAAKKWLKVFKKHRIIVGEGLYDDSDYKIEYDGFGINKKIAGRIVFGPNKEFTIYDSQNNAYAIVDIDGIDIMKSRNITRLDENLYLADDLYVGNLVDNMNGEKNISFKVFLKKIINNQEYYKVIYNGDECYRPFYENAQVYVIPFDKFNDYLLKNKPYLQLFIRNLYNYRELADAIEAYNRDLLMTDEQRQMMDDAINKAVEWWVNLYKNINYNTYFDKNNNQVTKTLYSDRDFNLFKEYLELKIRTGLLSENQTVIIENNLDPGGCLKYAEKMSGIRIDLASFPYQIYMVITSSRVLLLLDNGKKIIELYKGEKKNQDRIKKM